MIRKKNIWLVAAAALTVGLVGCNDSSGSGGSAGSGGSGGSAGSGGGGGEGGEGGSGGMPEGAQVTVAHFAPEIPTAEDTNVDILVDGTAAIEDLEYGESTGRVMLDAGTYTFGVAVAGETDPVIELPPTTLEDGDDITVVAYRTNEDPFVNVFVFSNSTEDLESGFGRVNVAHGANDSALDPVTITTSNAAGDADCAALIPDFAFGTQVPEPGGEPLDVEADALNVGFDVTDDDNDCPDVGPVEVPVTDNVVSIVVAVDEDTEDGSLDPELWAIVDASDEPLPLINSN